MSNQRLRVADNIESRGRSGGSSACSSGSVSPIPIPVIAISPGDESSESEIEAEPARIFHRRVSTKRNVNSSVRIYECVTTSDTTTTIPNILILMTNSAYVDTNIIYRNSICYFVSLFLNFSFQDNYAKSLISFSLLHSP